MPLFHSHLLPISKPHAPPPNPNPPSPPPHPTHLTHTSHTSPGVQTVPTDLVLVSRLTSAIHRGREYVYTVGLSGRVRRWLYSGGRVSRWQGGALAAGGAAVAAGPRGRLCFNGVGCASVYPPLVFGQGCWRCRSSMPAPGLPAGPFLPFGRGSASLLAQAARRCYVPSLGPNLLQPFPPPVHPPRVGALQLSPDTRWEGLCHVEPGGEIGACTAAVPMNGWLVMTSNAYYTEKPLALTALWQDDPQLFHYVLPFEGVG